MRSLRRWTAGSLLGLEVGIAVLLGVASPPAGAAESGAASIDHAEPTAGGVRLLVSVPEASTVDLASVRVRIDDQDVDATAVAAASTDDVRRTSILAIDTSASMRGERIAAAKRAADTYLASVPANVRVGVVTFADTVVTRLAPTTDRGAARAVIDRLTLTRGTALYDGVLAALRAGGSANDDSGLRKVLVLSDGEDTTTTPLASVLAAVKKADTSVDVVTLGSERKGDSPLEQLAAAGRGEVLNARNAKGLTQAYARQAAALGRQIVVSADVPRGSSDKSANVLVSAPTAGGEVTAEAYLPVRTAAPAPRRAAAAPASAVVRPQGLTASRYLVLGGVAALAVGLFGSVAAFATGRSAPSKGSTLQAQMQAYGSVAATRGQSPDGDVSLAASATSAAERALANNRSIETRIAASLEAAGVALKPAEWLLVHGGLVIALGALGLLVSTASLLVGLFLIALGILGPWVYLGLKRSRRLKAFSQGLADTLQLMSGSLSAGLSLAQSIDVIVREGAEPITSEFKRVMVESRLGVTLEDALDGVAERMQSRDFEWVVMAIRIQREVGGNLSELLLNVAATLREREFVRRHVRALSAEGRLSAYVLGGLPPVFLGYLTLTKPDYVAPLYTTPLGWMLLVGMVVLLGVGIVWMMKVAKVEL